MFYYSFCKFSISAQTFYHWVTKLRTINLNIKMLVHKFCNPSPTIETFIWSKKNMFHKTESVFVSFSKNSRSQLATFVMWKSKAIKHIILKLFRHVMASLCHIILILHATHFKGHLEILTLTYWYQHYKILFFPYKNFLKNKTWLLQLLWSFTWHQCQFATTTHLSMIFFSSIQRQTWLL